MSNANHFKMKPQLEVKLELHVAFNARVQIPVYWWHFRLPAYFQLSTIGIGNGHGSLDTEKRNTRSFQDHQFTCLK